MLCRPQGNPLPLPPLLNAIQGQAGKRESSQILCRPEGDPLFYWIPVCAGMVRGIGLPIKFAQQIYNSVSEKHLVCRCAEW